MPAMPPPEQTELHGRSCAKINLTLSVGAARPDGYHGLESLVAQVSLADEVAVRVAPPGMISVECDVPGIPCDDTNLAVRAARALAGERAAELGAHIRLVKRVPAGAGLGGGSSNAAAALQLLNQLWQMRKSQTELATIGASVGSDVPLFFGGPLCVMRGRGEQVQPVRATLVGCVLLAIPPVHSSTAGVYGAFDRLRRPAAASSAGSSVRRSAEDVIHEIARPNASLPAGPPQIHAPDLMAHLFNDLEPAAVAVSEALRIARDAIRAVTSLPFQMTGSGSAFFCLLDKYEDRRRLAAWGDQIRAAAPGTRVAVCYCPP